MILKLIVLIIEFLHKPLAGVTTAILFFIVSFLLPVHSLFSNFLRILTGLVFGIVVNHFWQSRVIENERREERIKVIEEFTRLRRFGLKEILPERDNREIKIHLKTFDFLQRFKEFKPWDKLIIIGLTNSYIPVHCADQIRVFLKENNNLNFCLEIRFSRKLPLGQWIL